jgi:hypothetical protein
VAFGGNGPDRVPEPGRRHSRRLTSRARLAERDGILQIGARQDRAAETQRVDDLQLVIVHVLAESGAPRDDDRRVAGTDRRHHRPHPAVRDDQMRLVDEIAEKARGQPPAPADL